VASSPTTPPPDGTPQCADVWKARAKLPEAYKFCYEGSVKKNDATDYCEFGRRIFSYDDHFYAVRSGTIHKTAGSLMDDKGYLKVMAACMG
jgi:hypothetical protein